MTCTCPNENTRVGGCPVHGTYGTRDFFDRPRDVHAAAEGPDTGQAQDLCDHGCGVGATVQHADGRFLCLHCYRAEVDRHALTPTDCPTCSPVSPVAPQLVEALRFYAEPESHAKRHRTGTSCNSDVDYDRGDIARAALAAVVPETPGTGGADA